MNKTISQQRNKIRRRRKSSFINPKNRRGKKILISETKLIHTYYNRKIRLGKRKYKSHLKSKHWKEIREFFKGKPCTKCNSKENINIHHLTYRFLGTKKERDSCIPLCKYCHKDVHEYAKAEDLSLMVATKEFILS